MHRLPRCIVGAVVNQHVQQRFVWNARIWPIVFICCGRNLIGFAIFRLPVIGLIRRILLVIFGFIRWRERGGVRGPTRSWRPVC